MRQLVHRARDGILAIDLPVVRSALGAAYTRLATRAEGQPCGVSWSDGAWLHTWSDGAYLCPRPVRHPITEVRHLYPYFFYDYTPQPGDIAVDVGAGVGTETAELSRLVGESGRVISIEAHAPSARLCQRLVDHLGLTNVTVINAAVTSGETEVRITDTESEISNHLGDSGVVVRGGSLPALLAEAGVDSVDYLKVNIEGAERLLFAGVTGSGLRIREICVSCHDFIEGDWFRTFASTEQWLHDAGYAVTRHPAEAGAPFAEFYLYGSLTTSS